MLETQLEGSTSPAPATLAPTRVESRRPRVVRLAGELDIVTAPRAAEIMRAALMLDDVVIVDLRELVFIDVAGLHVILDASARSRADGQRVVVVRGPAPVDRVFALTQADHLIEFVDLGPLEPVSTLEALVARGADRTPARRTLSIAPPLPAAAGVAPFVCSLDEELEERVEERLRRHLAVIAPRLKVVRPAAPGRVEAIS